MNGERKEGRDPRKEVAQWRVAMYEREKERDSEECGKRV